MRLQKRNGAGASDFGQARLDVIRIDLVRPFAFEAEQNGAIGAVPFTGQSERAEELRLQHRDMRQAALVLQALHEQARRAHRADGMRAGRADADFE